MTKKPIVLIIRDGWGINPGGRDKATENGDATLLAKTPFHDHLYATYPQATLSASGMDVGLPEGQMGNSEVGHLNLGAGRVVTAGLRAHEQGNRRRGIKDERCFARGLCESWWSPSAFSWAVI